MINFGACKSQLKSLHVEQKKPIYIPEIATAVPMILPN
jgi:hypothetical protein